MPAIEIYKNSSVSDCTVVVLPKVSMTSGSITAVNAGFDIPFKIQRVYYLYDIPAGEERGGHAHKDLYQLIVALSGSFDVILKDGSLDKTITLNRPHLGLQIIPGIWRELVNFSGGAIAMVLASEKYTESDYVRDINEFIKSKDHR